MEEVKKAREKRHPAAQCATETPFQEDPTQGSKSQLVLSRHLPAAEFLCHPPPGPPFSIFLRERGSDTGREEGKKRSYAVLLPQSECKTPARVAARPLYLHLSDTDCDVMVLILFSKNAFLHLDPRPEM